MNDEDIVKLASKLTESLATKEDIKEVKEDIKKVEKKLSRRKESLENNVNSKLDRFEEKADKILEYAHYINDHKKRLLASFIASIFCKIKTYSI